MFQDKELTCIECGVTFLFTANDQAFFHEKGFVNEPKRCKTCRERRKGGGSRPPRAQMQRGDRKMYPATCTICGRATQVPFRPTPGKPVKCKTCLGSSTPSRYAAHDNF